MIKFSLLSVNLFCYDLRFTAVNLTLLIKSSGSHFLIVFNNTKRWIIFLSSGLACCKKAHCHMFMNKRYQSMLRAEGPNSRTDGLLVHPDRHRPVWPAGRAEKQEEGKGWGYLWSHLARGCMVKTHFVWRCGWAEAKIKKKVWNKVSKHPLTFDLMTLLQKMIQSIFMVYKAAIFLYTTSCCAFY